MNPVDFSSRRTPSGGAARIEEWTGTCQNAHCTVQISLDRVSSVRSPPTRWRTPFRDLVFQSLRCFPIYMDTVQERIEGHPFPFIYMTRPCSTCTRRLPCLFTNLLRNMPLYRLERKSTLPWRYQFGEGRRHGSIEEREKKQQTNSIDPNGLCENMVVMKTKIRGERGRSIVPTTPVGHARNSAEQIITFILELMPVNAGEQNCTLFV